MNIRAEIEKAVGTKQGKKEDIDEYLERLIDEVNDDDEGLSDKAFDKLSKEAQAWLNKGATALDKEKPVPAFPEEEEEEEDETPAPKKGKKGKKGKKAPEPEDEEEEEDETPAPKKGKKGKKDAEKPAEKKEKKPAAKKEKKDKKPSAISRIQFFTCKHPKMDKEKIAAKVRKEGYEVADATVSIQYGQAHKIMAILEEING